MYYFRATIQQGAVLLLLVAAGTLCTTTATSTSTSSTSTSTTTSSSDVDTRFPPRHYSFDPRPNIDPSVLLPAEASDSKSSKEDAEDAAIVSSNSSEHDEAAPSTGEEGEEKIADLNKTDLQEGPRAIVDVQRQTSSGGVSYIIHPDNLPPPVYKPLEDLPPPSHPVAQWRPDLFMKLISSDTEVVTGPSSDDNTPSLEIRDSKIENDTSSSDPHEMSASQEGSNEDTGDTHSGGELLKESVNKTKSIESCSDDENCHESTSTIPKTGAEASSTSLPLHEDHFEPTATSERSAANLTQLVVELGALGDVANKHLLEASSNHTPRYEESSTSTYQDMVNFLKDIASSDGFQNAFLGDLISNFGSLDENAMKLIYSLLIRPLEAAHQGSKKRDRMGAAPDTKPDNINRLPFPFAPNFLMLNKDKLPLRDEPANGYHPFFMSPPQKNPTGRPAHKPILPSPAMQATDIDPSDHAWLPTRSRPNLPPKGLRGDEGVDVITAPPFQNFEIVLGSSLNHDGNQPRIGDWEEPQPHPPHPSQPQPSRNAPQHPLPFNKLRLGLEMPPPDALDALPPGSVLIPPSYILKQAKLPQVITKKDGTPGLEMPLSEFLPNLPFFPNDKPQRLQPPAKPQAQDIPPRLPSFLSSFLSSALSHPKPQKTNPVRNRPPPNRQMFHHRRPPTGPPPPITKLAPPVAKISTDSPVRHYPTPPSPTFTPPALPNPASYLPHKPVDQGNPNVLPNSLSPGGLGGAAQASVPVFVSVPPKKPASVDQSVSGPPKPHEESPVEDVVLDEVGAPRPDGYEPAYVDYSDRASFGNASINYDHQYYGELPPDYILEYYDYQDYYDQQPGRESILESDSSNSDTSNFHAVVDSHDSIAANDTALSTSNNSTEMHDSFDPFHPSIPHENPLHITVHAPDVAEIHPFSNQELHPHFTGPPFPGFPFDNPSPPTLSEQEKSDLQMLLQNHQVNALAEANGTVLKVNNTQGAPSAPPQDTGADFMHSEDYYEVPATSQRGSLYHSGAPARPVLPSASPSPVPPSEVVHYGGSDFGISHLWNNVQLIPLAPELFDSAAESPASEDNLNLTSLFHDAVPISPVEQPRAEDDALDVSMKEFDISIQESDSEKTMTPEEEVENAKFMAYVLIGACCGLALLSVAGIIVIVRFKKTCGSRQIRTRTRLTDQNSLDNSSRHEGVSPGDNLTLGGESGHKLGSWFTGRHEHLGSGKLRSNMTLPNVHDHKREKKSGSTRDLLSLTSESSASSCTSSPRQGRGVEPEAKEDEPRGSWLHGEYRASQSDLSISPGQDVPYMPHHYNGRDPHGHASSSRSNHPSSTSRQQDTFRYRTESSMESEELQQRSSRERRYTGGKTDHERSSSGRRPRYVVSSLESEELDDRLRRRDHVPSSTDSEAEDRTTHYDDDEESRDPSCYTGHSRELDDTVISRGMAPAPSMTSQELGDHLSRDLKQYQSHRNREHQEDSREMAEEENDRQELRRSQSQVSFSRDNVQNEVFLEFDNIFRQHGQYLTGDPLPPASTLGRVSRGTTDTLLSISRANTPDSIDLSHHQSMGRHRYHHDSAHHVPSPPTTPPRFSPPPAPPRPPKPGHLSQPGTPSPKAERGRLADEGSRHQRSSGNSNNEGERLI